MKVIVDMDRCADHGQCVYSAPEVFQLDAAGKLVFEQCPDQALRERIEDAMDVCPMQAISIED